MDMLSIVLLATAIVELIKAIIELVNTTTKRGK